MTNPLARKHESITDDIELLLDVLPSDIRDWVERQNTLENLLEIVCDLGREPEARYPATSQIMRGRLILPEDLEFVTRRVGIFGKDNRAGIERTLHRISAIRNRRGDIVGLTCRVGRAVYGTIDIIRDVVESGKSVLLLGRPGIGKTTKCREVARVLSEEFGKRVIVVDTSNEIAGDGDIPHPGIGRARRMQVPAPELQHAVMIEAVENHMPEVIVIDEIGTQEDALAARTIAERGVQLVATAHGNTLDRLLLNPTLSDIVGGIQAVTLSDEEARRRKTQKTVLERKAPPTFEIVIEILEVDKLAVHHDVAAAVDQILRGLSPHPEIRIQTPEGRIEVIQPERPATAPSEEPSPASPTVAQEPPMAQREALRIFPYGVDRRRLERGLEELGAEAVLTRDPRQADVVLCLKAHFRRQGGRLRDLLAANVPCYVVKSNTYAQIVSVLRDIFPTRQQRASEEEKAIQEAEEGVFRVLGGEEAAELYPQRRHVRRLQHALAARYGLRSESLGSEPQRRVRIYRT
ncbi:MAG TPA: R3H domain-containing nucleic acid-binding protein [Alphaproteobacteria bacterium]|nr:R3H domain-containing nucleic acid-binding protein [Alphaproteobacteria bacterium]